MVRKPTAYTASATTSPTSRPFDQVAEEFSTLSAAVKRVIHNAAFDIGFADHEFRMLQQGIPEDRDLCTITDSLLMARRLFPGKRNKPRFVQPL